MAAKLNYDTMRYIFQYLNGIDLYRASLVCRFWLEIAEDEKISRGPVCIIKAKADKITIKIWEAKLEETLRFLRIKTYLQMHFTQNLLFPTLTEECYCRYMPLSCLSLFLGNFYVHKDHNYISNLFLPDVSSIKITTRSFLTGPWNELLFCPEITAYMESSLENFNVWQSSFEDIFTNIRSMPSCMIFLCDRSSIHIAKSLMEYYLNWFPDNRISVWGGILDVLTICLFKNNKRLCRRRSSCASIFISGVNMRTWIVTLNDDCSTKEEMEKKLTDFKMDVKLRKHSIGLIYISNSRFNRFNDLEFIIFKETFPKLPVVYVCGIAGFGGDLNDILKTISKITLESYMKKTDHLYTAIMILTYN